MRPVTLAIIAAMSLLTLAADASACQRCGLFNRNCRFQHHHAQAVVVKAIDHHAAYQAPTTLNIVNNYPNALLATQGTADYGISLRNSIQPIDSSYIARQSERLLEHSASALNLAAGMSVDEKSGLLTLQSKALDVQELGTYVQGIQALRQGQTANSQVLQFKLSQKGIETAPPAAHQELNVFAAACARCHTGEKAKGGLQLDDGITPAELEAMQEAVQGGTMPPADTPERGFIDQLRQLLGQ